MTTSLLSPRALGFPESFESFRPAQEDAIDFALTSDKRFCGIGAPPGVGKSGIAFALAKLLGGRTVILTSTLGLQDQYHRTFGPAGLIDMRGRANFHCWEGGTCEDGGRLGCKDKLGCPYMCQLRAFNAAEICETSYAWWLAVHEKNPQAIRPPDTLICDEAGLASEWLSRSLDFYITERECREAGLKFPRPPGETVEEWIKIGSEVWQAADTRYTGLKTQKAAVFQRDKYMRELKHAEAFLDRSSKLEQIDKENWIVEREDGTDYGRLWRFECIWPGRYRERLFRGIQRVVLMSATLRPKTLGLLGISRSDVDFREWPRQFPAANGPVIWLPTVRVGSKMGEEDERRWIERHRQIFNWGADRKGLSHSVSFARAKRLAESCPPQRLNFLNGNADPDSTNARVVYERFLAASDGSRLISPSFGTGWDFKGRAAEYQIICKIPFPDTRSRVMTARCDADKGYQNYLAAQELVQASGRIVRSETDRGVTFIIDDHINWFMKAAEDHLPKWFKVRREDELPPPLPRCEA